MYGYYYDGCYHGDFYLSYKDYLDNIDYSNGDCFWDNEECLVFYPPKSFLNNIDSGDFVQVYSLAETGFY